MAKPKEGDTRGWNSKTGTGYKWEVKNGKGKWIRYRNNKRQVSNTVTATGNVDVVGGLKTQTGRLLRTVAGLPDDEQIAEAREAGKRYRKNNEERRRNKLTVTVPESARKGVKLDPKFTGGKNSVRSGGSRVASGPPSSKNKPSSTKRSSTKQSSTETDKKAAAWAKRTRNSPAARSGAFSDAERYALHQKHAKWKADRAAGKLKKKKFNPRLGRNQRR